MQPNTKEKLEEAFTAEWEEQAPMMGPPTYWCARRNWDEAHLELSINFSPFKDRTDASFEISGSDFQFTGETRIDGYGPLDALHQLLDQFETHCIDRLDPRVDS